METNQKTQAKDQIGTSAAAQNATASVAPAVVAAQEKRDTKGRPLIVGAWYALYDEGQNIGAAALAEWDGEQFVDENAEPIWNHDPDFGLCEFDHACLQHCKAASAAGVVP